MICIYCKQPSTDAQNREHVLPHALGSQDWVLTLGAVCDRCNSYFGSKVDLPFTNAGAGLGRHLLAIPGKKGVARWEGLPKGAEFTADLPNLDLPEAIRVKSVQAFNPRRVSRANLGEPTGHASLGSIPLPLNRVASAFLSRLTLATVASHLGSETALKPEFDLHRKNMATAADDDHLPFQFGKVGGESATDPSCVVVLFRDGLLLDLWNMCWYVMRFDGVAPDSAKKSAVLPELPRGPIIRFCGNTEWTEERVNARIHHLLKE